MNLSNLIISLDKVTSFGHRKSLRGQKKQELISFLEKLKSSVSTKAPLFKEACDYILLNLKNPKTLQKIKQKITERSKGVDGKQLLLHITNLEETIDMAYKGYQRLNTVKKGNLPLMKTALEDMDLDLSMIRFLLPRTYEQILQKMDDMDVVKILEYLGTDPTLSKVDDAQRKINFKKLIDFNNWLKEFNSHSGTVPVLVRCQLNKLADKLTTLINNISTCYEFKTNKNLSTGYYKVVKEQIEKDSSERLSFVVNPAPIRDHLKTSRNNHFMRGLAKIGLGLTASLMSTVLPDSIISVEPDIARKTTKDVTNEVDHAESPESENTPKKQDDHNAQSSKLNSSNSLSKSDMNGNAGMQPGELKQGGLVYKIEPNSSKNPFLINQITHYQGNEKKNYPININLSNQGETLQTIHLAPNDYKEGETILLLTDPSGVTSIGGIRINKPSSFSRSGNLLTLKEDLENVEISYNISDHGHSTNPTLPKNISFTPPEVSDPAQKLLETTQSGKFSPEQAKNYLGNFTYMISSEIQRLIDEMPGTQERNLSFLKIGDCDMLSEHLAWLLQGNLACGVGHGYLDEDNNRKVYSSDAHSRFMYQDGNQIIDFETTSPVQAAYIMPDSSFKPEDLESLKTIVNQITTAKSQNARDKLMTDFSNKLKNILEDPYYKQFIIKNNPNTSDEKYYSDIAKPYEDRVLDKSSELDPNNPNTIDEQYHGDIAKSYLDRVLDKSSELDPMSSLMLGFFGILGILSAIGTGSFVLGGKKRFEKLKKDYYLFKSNNRLADTIHFITTIPIEGSRVLFKPVTVIPLGMHRLWTKKVTDKSQEEISGLLSKGYGLINNDSLDLISNSLSQLTNSRRVAIPKTQLAKVIAPFAEYAAKIIPTYKPLWKQIITDLELIAEEGLTRSNALALIRKHFESETLRKEFHDNIPNLVDELVSTDISEYKKLQSISDSINQNDNSTKGLEDGKFSSNRRTNSGEFHSNKEYQAGDDLRHIDSKATARNDPSKPPVIKVFTDTNSRSRATHTITVLVNIHSIATIPGKLYYLVYLLRLSMMKNSPIKVNIDLYSLGDRIHRFDEQFIETSLKNPRNASTSISGILKKILNETEKEAIFMKLNPLPKNNLINKSLYPQTNFWSGHITNLLTLLQGDSNIQFSKEYPSSSKYVLWL